MHSKFLLLGSVLARDFLASTLFDRGHLDSLTDGSWQGDSLALTEDEATILMEEIEEEQDLKLLDIR